MDERLNQTASDPLPISVKENLNRLFPAFSSLEITVDSGNCCATSGILLAAILSLTLVTNYKHWNMDEQAFKKLGDENGKNSTRYYDKSEIDKYKIIVVKNG